MKKQPITDQCCNNPHCPLHGQLNQGNIKRHSLYTTKQGRRRRYCCKKCGKTFCSTASTAYYRLHKSRKLFDEVAQMSVEGVSKSAISRIKGLSWNTVASWQQKAAKFATQTNENLLHDYELIELQADEICTFVDSRKNQKWIHTVLEVWSRLWIGSVFGRRSYKNVKRVIIDAVSNGRFTHRFLFTTDGYEPYAWAAKSVLGMSCIYAQVFKKRRNNRVIKVDRKLIIGTDNQLERSLFNSEDSSTINTSFVERHNLTIRQGSAYLNRRTACHCRQEEFLEDHLQLLKCYYNFIRQHGSLRFGNEVRTPAMQAGLVYRKLSFRDVFLGRAIFLFCVFLAILVTRNQVARRARYRPSATVA
jgi:IS1 family transposase/transposase-like protein